MNKMISNPSSSNASIAHTLETLEALEESIISSIRSAGIPQKAREISIVDKMMDLRRWAKAISDCVFELLFDLLLDSLCYNAFFIYAFEY